MISRRSLEAAPSGGPLRTIGRSAVVALAAVGAALLLVFYTPFANLLARPLLASPPGAPTASGVIVVLSGGRYDDGSLNESALERTVTAVRLYHRGLAPRLVFSGGPCCGRSASAIMAKLATELGVPRIAITLEEDSLSTRDNAVRVAALLRRNGWRSPILVTSPLHMRRSALAFAATGTPIQPVPASERSLRLSWGPSERMALLHDVAHEYLGLVYYRLRGWI